MTGVLAEVVGGVDQDAVPADSGLDRPFRERGRRLDHVADDIGVRNPVRVRARHLTTGVAADQADAPPGRHCGDLGVSGRPCVVEEIGAGRTRCIGDARSVGVHADDDLRIPLPDGRDQANIAVGLLLHVNGWPDTCFDSADVDDVRAAHDDLIDPVEGVVECVSGSSVVERVRRSVDDRHDGKLSGSERPVSKTKRHVASAGLAGATAWHDQCAHVARR
jgi:hypothetical protein